jgi:hypothetical protein
MSTHAQRSGPQTSYPEASGWRSDERLAGGGPDLDGVLDDAGEAVADAFGGCPMAFSNASLAPRLPAATSATTARGVARAAG